MCSDSSEAGSGKHDGGTRRLTLELERFVWEALEKEATGQQATVEEVARFAILYYLADGDSGRIARRLPSIHPLSEPHPLGKLLGD